MFWENKWLFNPFCGYEHSTYDYVIFAHPNQSSSHRPLFQKKAISSDKNSYTNTYVGILILHNILQSCLFLLFKILIQCTMGENPSWKSNLISWNFSREIYNSVFARCISISMFHDYLMKTQVVHRNKNEPILRISLFCAL